MKYYIIVFGILLFSCEKKEQSNQDVDTSIPLLFTEGYRCLSTKHDEGYNIIDYSYDFMESFDTTIIYYAFDSIISYNFEDTSFSYLFHCFKYKYTGIVFNRTTDEEMVYNQSGIYRLFRVDENGGAIYGESGGFIFNVEVGDTIGEYSVFTKVVTGISFVILGPYRLKRIQYATTFTDGTLYETDSYVQGILTMKGLFFDNVNLEYLEIDGIKYTPDDIIPEE